MRTLLTLSFSLFCVFAFAQKAFIGEEEKRDFVGTTRMWTFNASNDNYFYQLEAVPEKAKILVRKRDLTAKLLSEKTLELDFEGNEVHVVELLEMKGQVYALGYCYLGRDKDTRHLVRFQLNLEDAIVVDATEFTTVEKQRSPALIDQVFLDDTWSLIYSPDSSRVLLLHRFSHPASIRGQGNTYRSTFIIIDEAVNVIKKVLPDEINAYDFGLMGNVSLRNSGDIYFHCMIERPKKERTKRWDEYESRIALLPYSAIPGTIAFLNLDTDERRVKFANLDHSKDGHLIVSSIYTDITDGPGILKGIVVIKLADGLNVQNQFDYPMTGAELVNDSNTDVIEKRRLIDEFGTIIHLKLIEESDDKLLFNIGLIKLETTNKTMAVQPSKGASRITPSPDTYQIEGINIILKFSMDGKLIWHTNIDKYTKWKNTPYQPSLLLPLKEHLYFVHYNGGIENTALSQSKDVFLTVLNAADGKVVQVASPLIEYEYIEKNTLKTRFVQKLNDSTYFLVAEKNDRRFYPILLQLE